MSEIQKSVDVNVPVRTAYNQWTQFEEFPRFMRGVEEVRQVDDRHLHWKALVGGKTVEWDAEIHEQVPDQCIAWRSTSGVRNEGTVLFKHLGPSRCRITLLMTVEPQRFTEKVGDALGAISSQVKNDLDRFQAVLESRQVETGAWRGEIHETDVERPSLGA